MKRLVLAVVVVLAACSSGGGGTPPITKATPTPVPGQFPPPSLSAVQQISSDPFTNGSSQHATEVEPSAASSGMTIVGAVQTGRFMAHGASDIGFATSLDGGMTWQHGTLPGTTQFALPPGPYDSISDPSVAYDARHATWLIAGLPIFLNGSPSPAFLVSRSPDGVTWSTPVAGTPANETDADKEWITCDDHNGSPYYGHCYVEWDRFNGNGVIEMSTSADGGQTWSAPAQPAVTTSGGIGGQPVVQPNGTVIVPIDDLTAQHVLAFRSIDGGASWTQPVTAAPIADHQDAGNLRSLPLISGAIDAAGTVYVVWQDCRFRASCAENDLVMMTSHDGLTWTSPARIPIDAVTSSVDHFLPGLGIDPSTSGSGAHIGLTFYEYANSLCSAASCALSAAFISSQDGGATWGAPQLLAGPMSLSWLAQTLDGAMVGDYMATVFSNGAPIGFAAIAEPPASGVYNEAAYVPRRGALAMQSAIRRSSAGERPVRGFHADHPPRRIHP
jgi:hypothetical protein